jgi:hypothetical protein
MAILANQDDNKKKGSAPKTVGKGTRKAGVAKDEKSPTTPKGKTTK